MVFSDKIEFALIRCKNINLPEIVQQKGRNNQQYFNDIKFNYAKPKYVTDEYLRVGKCWDTINIITHQKNTSVP